MKASPHEFAAAARMFKALAHPVRLRLLRALLEHDCCASEVERCLGISQPNVSQHLKILKETGLVAGRREGTRICYRITDDRVERLLKIVNEGNRKS